MSLLTWVGSKKRLLPYLNQMIEQYLNETTGNDSIYVKPYLGSGPVLINVLERYPDRFQRFVCCDANEALAEVFKQIKTNPNLLIIALEQIQDLYCSLDMEEQKELFYLLRAEFNELRLNRTIRIGDPNRDLLIASLFIFLNKTCFRGVLIVIKAGELVCTFGYLKRRPKIVDHELIRKLHRLFIDNDVQFYCCSYDEIGLGDE